MNAYVLGTLIRLAARFQVAGVDADPTAVVFKVRAPGGTITTYTFGTDAQLVKAATGLAITDLDGNVLWTSTAVGTYYVDFITSTEGIHAWRMAGTGAATAAEEQQFVVRDSRFTA